ncbi:MAG TPA: 2-amino-4-hydroxy-6-hydroxymethyldihydropteridine diphosphokinase [Bacteroidales bacterium]|nr:2-amino-4-hydroxy-6-hydroxymethyldihydropteridine diphosphokinase [Bacteroidales bacterium]
MKRIFLGLGTNLGDREKNLEQALDKIAEVIGIIVSRSSVYETEPWGFQSSDQFLNMVIGVDTNLKPSGLLGRLLMIESLLGRLRDGKQYSSRIIDIDILLYGRQKVDTISLKIPHPRMHERKFVLIPLCEIAPRTVHPVFGKTMTKLLKECEDAGKIKKL